MAPSTAEPSLSEKVLLIEAALQAARIPHAFGGAIALAYYAAPRGTENIDLNLFVSPDEVDKPLAHLERLGIHSTGLPPAGDEDKDAAKKRKRRALERLRRQSLELAPPVRDKFY